MTQLSRFLRDYVEEWFGSSLGLGERTMEIWDGRQNVTWIPREMVLMSTSYRKQSCLPDRRTEAPVALFWDGFQELSMDRSLGGHSVLLCSKHEVSSSLRGMTIMPHAASEFCWAVLPSYTIEALPFQVISSAHRTRLRKECACGLHSWCPGGMGNKGNHGDQKTLAPWVVTRRALSSLKLGETC